MRSYPKVIALLAGALLALPLAAAETVNLSIATGMFMNGGAEKTGIVLDALKLAGQRGVLATGWGGLAAGDVPDGIYLLESVPHHWLFPQVAAVVHHGGAGTTGAGLRAGRPTVVCPFVGDQFFWGRRVAALALRWTKSE